MHITVKNLINIQKEIKNELNVLNYKNLPKIIAVSKTFKIDKILPLIDHGHKDFGENKVQEAFEKWKEIKIKHPKINLHMIGKLQSNKVKLAVSLFDFIHSVDSKKLAKKIINEQIKINKKMKVFIQVNIGDETQKSGIDINELEELIFFCKQNQLNVVGLMCIPPLQRDATFYFKKMNDLNNNYIFSELSMGMSSDYLKAVKNFATYLRIGSSIFGKRV